MSNFFDCPVCGRHPKVVAIHPANVACAYCRGYAFHRHKEIRVAIFDQPSTLYETLASHWNKIQFREARFLYDSEKEIVRLTGNRMIPK